ncbi:hypothetical protein RUND412_004763 [Rhizina undulata]
MVFFRPLLVGALSVYTGFIGGYSQLRRDTFVNQTTCNGKTFTYQELAGYGAIPSDFRDKFGDTVSAGSSVALERKSWKKNGTSYEGTLWMLPDRGWNTNGTINYQPRIHKFKVSFTTATTYPSPENLIFEYVDTVLLTDPSGSPLTGLDATTVLEFDGYPNLPAAAYTGDGFGAAGSGGTRMTIDPEGLVLDRAGNGFWVSDEYGPFIYRFDASGKMKVAIKPVEALIPIRNEIEDFSSDNPPLYNPALMPSPIDPSSGRTNNQGFEGLTISGDGKNLYALMQSATVQEGGLKKTTNRNARFLKYDISNPEKPRFAKEYVPTKKSSKPRTAAQSEILALGSNQFFVLSHDSGFGHGQAESESVYRQIDIFDISNATNIKGEYDSVSDSILEDGVLRSDITPATYCSFLDFNVNSELSKFGLHNGGEQDASLLNEKWESLAILPVDGLYGGDDEWFVLSVSDNDFVTQDGYLNFGTKQYADASGYNLDTQALVFKVKFPEHSRPFPRNSGG